MKRLTILFIALCLPIVMAEEQEQNQPNRIHLAIYRGAEPFVAQFQSEFRQGAGSTTLGTPQSLIAALPETARPWKPEQLENVKIFLPLGEGESIDDRLYRFTANWDNRDKEKEKPLRVYQAERSLGNDFPPFEGDAALRTPESVYRPIELVTDNVVRFKFEFVPIRFKPITTWEGMGNMMRFTNAPVPEFLDPLVIDRAGIEILVNGKREGFNIHFSRDGEKWYGTRIARFRELSGDYLARGFMPPLILPFETLYVRVATDNGEPIEQFFFDFEAVLLTHGFRGTGETFVSCGTINRRDQNGKHPQAFFDSNNDIHFLLYNASAEPVNTGGALTTQTRGELGGGSGHGVYYGPIIPANSFGVFTFVTLKDPGSYRQMFGSAIGSFDIVYHVAPDKTAPNPSPLRMRNAMSGGMRGNWEERAADLPYVRFED